MAGVDDPQAAVGQPLVEELGIDERNDAVVAPVMSVTGVAICGSSSGSSSGYLRT